MRTPLVIAVLVGLLSEVPTLAQRPRRPKADTTGPVSVSRGTTLRLTISSDPPDVFSYLSDATKLSKWFPDQAIFEAQIGGKYHFRWNGVEGVWSGVVTEFIRGNTLAFTWQPPGELYETNVRIKLLPQDLGTMVELAHTGFTSAESLDKAIEAWRIYLRNLKSVIETGTDLRKKASPRRTPARTPVRRRPA